MKLLVGVTLAAGIVVHTVAHPLRTGGVLVPGAYHFQPLLPVNFFLESCEADPTTCASTADQIKNLSKPILDRVAKQFDEFNESVSIARQAIVDCNATHVGEGSFNSEFEHREQTHRICRTEQQRLDTELASQTQKLDTMIANMNATCGKVESYKWDDKGCFAEPVKYDGKNATGDLRRHLEKGYEQFHLWLDDYAEAENNCSKDTMEYLDQNKTVETATENHGNKVKECDAMLADLEQFTCGRAESFTDRCAAYELCYQTTLNNFNELKDQVSNKNRDFQNEFTAGKQLACMGDAVGSDGTVNIAQMLQCQSTTWTFDEVSVPPNVTKADCPSPTLYGGSKAYREEVYTGLPVSIALPTLCLGWINGCQNRTTFSGADVQLKLCTTSTCNPCTVSWSSVTQADYLKCDVGVSPGKFRFQDRDAVCDRTTLRFFRPGGGTCTLVYHPWAVGDSPNLFCNYNTDWDIRENFQVTSDLAAARTGKVELKSDRPNPDGMQWGGEIQSGWNGYWNMNCSTSNGYVYLAWSQYKDTNGQSLTTRDRDWNLKCKKWPVIRTMNEPTSTYSVWPKSEPWRSSTLTCPVSSVMIGMASWKDGKWNPRTWIIYCRKVPQGWVVPATASSGDTSPSKKQTYTFTSDSGQAMVGMTVGGWDNDNKDRSFSFQFKDIKVAEPQELKFEVVYDSGT